ncbi:MAG: helix-turn-helix domain-containing protein [Marinobacter sp.]
MYVCKSQSYVLEHFLRLNTVRPESWLSALQVLTNSPGLSQKILFPQAGKAFQARLSFLPSEKLNICGTYLQDASQVSGANADSMAVIMPVSGTVTFEVMDDRCLCNPWTPFVLDPNEDFQATVSDESHLLIIQMTGLGSSRYRRNLQQQQAWLANLLSGFLYETPFFRNHDHALIRLERLSEQLYSIVDEQQGVPVPASDRRKRIGDDRRLCKAIQLMNEELGTDIHIASIASRAGLSLRNLHYLMKQYTGQSPYQYIRCRRLIRAREAIIRDYPGSTSIAEQADRWGFQHPGRFAAYYLKHFGEYPNETLRGLDRLKQYTDQVKSVHTAATTPAHYWLSSSAGPECRPPREARETSGQDC